MIIIQSDTSGIGTTTCMGAADWLHKSIGAVRPELEASRTRTSHRRAECATPGLISFSQPTFYDFAFRRAHSQEMDFTKMEIDFDLCLNRTQCVSLGFTG